MTERGRWHFEDDGGFVVPERTPPLVPEVRNALIDLLAELTASRSTAQRFLAAWHELRERRDPDARIDGMACEIHIEGDEVSLLPQYDQWDEDEIRLPLAVVQEMLDQYLAWLAEPNGG
ncbi:MAG: hypothetical protein WAM30_19880 [Candidatus Dormiibacterota bacterium]